MIAKIAVSAANFAIDKSYSYVIPQGMELRPGMRVTVPFGRGNRTAEGIVLSVEDGKEEGLKAVAQKLDDQPVLSQRMLQLASFMRQRYFCTFYDAAHAMLPAGLWFRRTDTYALTEDRSWEATPPRNVPFGLRRGSGWQCAPAGSFRGADPESRSLFAAEKVDRCGCGCYAPGQ